MNKGKNDWSVWSDRSVMLFAVVAMLGTFFGDLRAVSVFLGVAVICLETRTQRKLGNLKAEVSDLRAQLAAAHQPGSQAPSQG